MDSLAPLSERCRRFVEELHYTRKTLITPCPPHATEDGATMLLGDHLLTTAALVTCLAYSDAQRDLLRVAALTHDLLPCDYPRELAEVEEQTRPWRALLRQHGEDLDRGEFPNLAGLDPESRILALAHLAASRRLPITQAAEFAHHPLAMAGAVDLVYGGAVKIKGYVFESFKLPEIRGASALLDHINRLDLPAFWGVQPEPPHDSQSYRGQPEQSPIAVYEAQMKRCDSIGEWLKRHFGIAPLNAPECVLYASGGNILALAPAGYGRDLAAAIERRYTLETQVAQSVGVWRTCSLLELQYGLNASAFWLDQIEAQELFSSSEPGAQIFRQTFGIKPITSDSPRDALDAARNAFCQRKGFGELVTLLTTKANRRRMSDGAVEGEPRPLPFVEYVGTTRRCTSCDVRPASEQLERRDGRQEAFCEPCSCKRKAGAQAKKGPSEGEQRYEEYAWIRPWGTWLGTEVKKTSHDLHDISKHSGGFVGLIYADGNSVGEAVARLTSINTYRRFALRMLDANETAVREALKDFIAPLVRPDDKEWPFEIITIGGDDVLLFVPADQALDMCAEIAKSFEANMNEPGSDQPISLSVGVLIMPDATPIRFARDLVEQLLDSAKQLAKRDQASERTKQLAKPDAVGSTIDFMALKATTMITNRIEGYRSVALQRSHRNDFESAPRTTLRLTQRPYTLEQLNQFLEACRALKTARFPRSQLYQLREIVEQGDILRSAVDYRYFVERGRQRERDEKGSYATFDEHIQRLCDQQPWIPWRGPDESTPNNSAHHYDTPLLDLIELFPFVAVREEQGGSE